MSERWLIVALIYGATALSAGCTAMDSGRPAAAEAEAAGWRGAMERHARPAEVEAGHRIALANCSSCHAIDAYSSSPNAGAPPLRDVFALNDPDLLAYRLIDGIRMGHDSMPLFDFDIGSADALIAYIGTLGDPLRR
jgi:mono/diheme cytochrome c family protein